MGIHTKYGLCRGCNRWVPRDCMLSINITVFDKKNEESRILMRFCETCHANKEKELRKSEWNNVLKTELEVMTTEELAANSEIIFDDSEAAMRRAGLVDDSKVESFFRQDQFNS